MKKKFNFIWESRKRIQWRINSKWEEYLCFFLNDGITNIFNWLFDALLIAKLVLFIYRAFQLWAVMMSSAKLFELLSYLPDFWPRNVDIVFPPTLFAQTFWIRILHLRRRIFNCRYLCIQKNVSFWSRKQRVRGLLAVNIKIKINKSIIIKAWEWTPFILGSMQFELQKWPNLILTLSLPFGSFVNVFTIQWLEPFNGRSLFRPAGRKRNEGLINLWEKKKKIQICKQLYENLYVLGLQQCRALQKLLSIVLEPLIEM